MTEPLKRKAEEAVGEAEEGAPAVPSSDVLPSIEPAHVHVLLADDEKISRLVTSKLLRQCVPALGDWWDQGRG